MPPSADCISTGGDLLQLAWNIHHTAWAYGLLLLLCRVLGWTVSCRYWHVGGGLLLLLRRRIHHTAWAYGLLLLLCRVLGWTVSCRYWHVGGGLLRLPTGCAHHAHKPTHHAEHTTHHRLLTVLLCISHRLGWCKPVWPIAHDVLRWQARIALCPKPWSSSSLHVVLAGERAEGNNPGTNNLGAKTTPPACYWP